MRGRVGKEEEMTGKHGNLSTYKIIRGSKRYSNERRSRKRREEMKGTHGKLLVRIFEVVRKEEYKSVIIN